MEQFKIDVSKCTDDEKRRIQERLFEMGYERWGSADAIEERGWRVWYVGNDGKIVLGVEGASIDNKGVYPLRPASDFLTRFQTRPHDYTGCHPDIAAALKRGEDVRAKIDDDPSWITGYVNDKGMSYTAKADGSTASLWAQGDSIEPIPAEPIPAGAATPEFQFTLSNEYGESLTINLPLDLAKKANDFMNKSTKGDY